VLEALVSGLQGERGVAWLSPVDPTAPPQTAIPRDVSSTFIRTARRWARAALAGRTPSSRSLAGFVIGDRDDPLGVFVIGWNPRRRSNPRHTNQADAFTRFLRVAFRHSLAAKEHIDIIRGAHPTRAALELLSVLAHEMRTPLTTIKGYATALLDSARQDDPAVRRAALRAIEQETSTLTLLIAELLEAAAVDSGTLVLTLEPVLVNRMVERLVGEFAGRRGRHRFVVSFPSAWPVVRGDPRRLDMVFRNILDNAVKYSPRGGLVAVSGVAGRREVIVSIADQGIGIAPEDLNRLFERFFRARRTAGVPGSGLGLPIARAIVERHGGRIWAESTPGKGTTFHVALSRRPDRTR
jgi:signal transduction histidine kinase